MRPKIFRAFLQMEEMWGDHEREGVRRTPRYLKDETRSIGRREIVSRGNWLKSRLSMAFQPSANSFGIRRLGLSVFGGIGGTKYT